MSDSVSNFVLSGRRQQILLLGCFFFILNSDISFGADLKFNPDGILPSLRNVLTPDLATYEAPQWIKDEYPYYVSGFDYNNRPIWFIPFGKWDVRKVVKKGGKDMQDFDKYYNQIYYKMLSSRIRNYTESDQDDAKIVNPRNEVVLIYDLEGYSNAQVTSAKTTSYLKNRAKAMKDAFSVAHSGYFLNVSGIGKLVINIFKPLFGDLVHKTQVHGTNKKEWLPIMQKKFPRGQIPHEYGGYSNFTKVWSP